MMGWIGRLMGHNRGRTAPPPAPPRKRGNQYDPQLVTALVSEHRELLALATEITRAAEGRRYQEISRLLVRFKADLEQHLLTENYRFYAFVEDRMSGDADNADMVRDFRKEMGRIARQVTHFIRTWQEKGVNKNNAAQFRTEFAHIAGLLKRRIDREEEHLYPMYERMG